MVNGQAIALATYQAQLQVAMRSYEQQPGVDPQTPDGQAALAALRQQVLDWLIDQVLINQAAQREGIVVNNAQVSGEVERIRSENPAGFAEWLAANGFSEDSFRAQVRSDLLGAAMRDRVTQEVGRKVEQLHLRHILVDSEAQARALLDQIKRGSGTFPDLAAAHSRDEGSRGNGGDIGFVPPAMLPESVAAAALAMQPGQISGPVQSASGWHLLQLVERDPARDAPPELLATLRQEAFMRWLQGERAKAEIQRFVKE